MGILKDKFEKIEHFSDLCALITETKDGESPSIELKALKKGAFNKDNVGETKAVLAKEVCAFLNTNDGIIVWGCAYENGRLKIDNETGKNLENFLDSFIQNIVEPSPRGISFKTVTDAGKKCLIIFVPQSSLAPHRVGSWDAKEGKKSKDKKIGRYFQRIGTNSQVMPENIVRAMYLSLGRIPDISIYTALDDIQKNDIKISTFVKPDSQKYISEYYNSNQIAIITASEQCFQIIENEDNDIWREIHNLMLSSRNNPIYPDSEEYVLLSSHIFNDVRDDDNYLCGLMPQDENIHFTQKDFSRIFAIATKSSFSCNSVSLKTANKLYVLGLQDYWSQHDYDLERLDKLEYIEKEYGFEIYISKPYRNDLIYDDAIYGCSLRNGRISTKQIIDLLKELTGFNI